MATVTESAPRFEEPMGGRTVPIIITTPYHNPGEPMDITPTDSTPPASYSKSKSPESDSRTATSNGRTPTSQSDTTESNIMSTPAAAAAAAPQQKIVQTAFIHKLYNMLEDKTIQHLISWTPTAESFVMQPSHEFSKVLAQYFKHTNISSFVRQLNMYGFHKVSDVFHQGTPDSALWEFKHGNGNFKRGDLVGLREIKRRASRHALVHRDYNQKPPSSQPGTPAEPMPPMHETGDPRLNNMEHTLFDLNLRLQRSEESAHYCQVKQHAMVDIIGRLLQYNQELCRAVLHLAPTHEHSIHRDISAMQGEIQRHMEYFRSMEEGQDSSYGSSRPYLAQIDNAPVSPRQMPQDDPRRPSLVVTQPRPPHHNYRPQVPSHLSVSTRRPYGSIGGSTTQPTQSSQSSPSLRPPQPPPPSLHPLAHVEVPPASLARRHTSADIRADGWQPNPPQFTSGPPSSHWPASPNRTATDDQRIRDSFSQYSFQAASQTRSRPCSPPPSSLHPNGGNGGGPPGDTFGSWSWGAPNRGDNKSLPVKDSSLPPTRRPSMANILNPTETAEREDEASYDPRGDDDRKRKRIQ